MRNLVYALIFILILSSCTPVRQVVNNHFTSSYPQMSVVIDPSFKYLGSVKQSFDSKSTNDEKMLRNDAEYFIFVKDICADNIISTGLHIEIRKIETYFVSNYYDTKEKNQFDHGMIALGGNQYEFATKTVFPSMAGEITKYVKDNGYIIPNCIIMKSFSRIVYSNTVISYNYYERLPGDFPDARDWKDKVLLTDPQKKFLKEFSKRCDKAFRLSN